MSPDRVLGVIPARLGAERLPGKPLRLLGGKPLIQHVALNAKASGALDEVVVASDADEVLAAAASSGAAAVPTSQPLSTSPTAPRIASAGRNGSSPCTLTTTA